MRAGHVDVISRRIVAGWAADPDRPADRLTVSVAVDGVYLGDAAADRLRNDLASLGRFGDGRHGFAFTFPEPLGADADHLVQVTFKDDGAKLPNGEHRLAAGAQNAQSTRRAPPAANPAKPVPPPLAAAAPAARPAPAMAQQAAKTAPAAAPASAAATLKPGQKPGVKPALKPGTRPARGLMPILVTAPGRSGTTLLMSLLARSPRIVAAELVPYEVRLISYHATAFQVLTAPANLERSSHPDNLQGDGFHVGSNPFQAEQYVHAFRKRAPLQDYYEHYAPSRLAECAADLVREYYRRLADDRGKAEVMYFAEKGNNVHRQTRMFARQAFGEVRELVIARDPRDVLCSHMAYFSSESEKAFHHLSHAAQQLRDIRAENRADTHFLKYEDMVGGDAACFAALSDFLGAEITPQPADNAEKVFRKHATSASPEASVERWRTQLEPGLQERCATAWAPFLTTFGYAVE
jgi:hypothetical protein